MSLQLGLGHWDTLSRLVEPFTTNPLLQCFGMITGNRGSHVDQELQTFIVTYFDAYCNHLCMNLSNQVE